MLTELVTVALSIQAPAPLLPAAAALAAAMPICPNGVVVPDDQPCPLPAPPAQSIVFAAGDARLPGEARATLERIAGSLHADPNLRLLILAYAQEGPDPAAIEGLHRARASAVVEGLIGLGVRREQIASGAAGAVRPAPAGESDPQDRRVEIMFAQGAGPFVDSSGEFLTAEGSASSSADLLAGDLPFQAGFVEWEHCQRVNAAESARRAGRAGPGRAADYSGIRDCGSEYGRLAALVEALPADGRREQARAMIVEAERNIAAMAAEIYQRNNYE
jgi:hypothetical protein